MKRINIIIALGAITANLSCSDFLEEKPDIKMVIPRTLEDAELLLNDYTTMNTGYPLAGEWGTDDYYLLKERWEAIANQDQRNAYIWKDEPYEDASQWQRPYKAVYIANQVIAILSKLDRYANPTVYNRVYGAAHFFRAFAFHQLVEVYAPTYSRLTADSELGIPLRLSPDIDNPVQRATLQQTYEQITSDYKTAISNLPITTEKRGEPNKAAAHAGLARACIGMGEFEAAYAHADSALMLSPALMDFNELNPGENLPIPRFNSEVLFPAMSTNAGPMGLMVALVDSALYESYEAADLRKDIFFVADVASGGLFYRGNYDKTSAQLFVGLTSSEVYLIKAEAAARTQKIAQSLEALNLLLRSRYKAGTYRNATETDQEKLLTLILKERRKELLFRGRRWADLKRLNIDLRYRVTLVRSFGDLKYSLEPNSLKYAYRLPESVVRVGALQQNKR